MRWQEAKVKVFVELKLKIRSQITEKYFIKAGARGRTMSLGVSPDGSQTVEPKSLVNQLEYFFKQFQFFGLDNGYIEQIFMQLFYYICAISLNNLMLRQELCMWKTGMKIRYNVSCLEEWARKKKMVRDNLTRFEGNILELNI